MTLYEFEHEHEEYVDGRCWCGAECSDGSGPIVEHNS